MPENPPAFDRTQPSSTATQAVPWTGDVALAAAVGPAYLLVAQVTVWGLAFQPDKTALFWPPAGISSGVLIALGPRRRWPAVAGILAAEAIAAHLSWHTLWMTAIMAVCDPVEALTVAWLIARWFGPNFSLERTYYVVGLLVAAVAGAIAPSLMIKSCEAGVARAVDNDTADLAALVHRRRLRHRDRGANGDWAFQCPASSSVPEGICRRHLRTPVARDRDFDRCFAATRILGSPAACRLAVSDFVVACRPFAAGLCRGRGVSGFRIS